MKQPITPHRTPAAEEATPEWTRRELGRSAAALLAPAAMAGCATGQSGGNSRGFSGPTLPPDTRPLKVGWVGNGGRGSGAVAQALTADKNITLVAMGDIYQERQQKSLARIN